MIRANNKKKWGESLTFWNCEEQTILSLHNKLKIKEAKSRWQHYYWAGERKMEIPIISSNGDEDEIEMMICCYDCAKNSFGWNINQYNFVVDSAAQNKQIAVPLSVVDVNTFAKFVKTI